MTACMLPPAIVRRAVDEDWPTLAIGWAYRLGWTTEEATILAEQLLDFDEPSTSHDVRSFRRLFRSSDAEILRDVVSCSSYERLAPLSRDARAEWLEEIESTAMRQPWSGRTASSDRAVFLAIVRHGLQSDPVKLDDLPMSEREILRASGLGSLDTVSRARGRLMESGHLVRTERSDGVHADRFSIRWPIDPEGAVTGTSIGYQELGPDKPYRCSDFGTSLSPVESVAVGKAASRLIDRLFVDRPNTDRAWFEGAGVSRRQFYRAKAFMTESRLVERTPDGWTLGAEFDDRLAEIVRASGAVQRDQKMAARHGLERQGWRRHQLGYQGRLDRYEVDTRGRLVDRSTGEVVPAVAAIEPNRRARMPDERVTRPELST